MKKILAVAACAAVIGIVGSANADSLTDTTMFYAGGTDSSADLVDYGWGDVNELDGFGDWVKWEHTYIFDPAAEVINWATLEISIRDDGGWFDGWEFALGWTDSGEWDIGKVNTSVYDYDLDVSTVADGSLIVTLASVGGDFYIDKSELTIDYTPAAVPEPTTMLLFGTGLAGLAGVARRKRK